MSEEQKNEPLASNLKSVVAPIGWRLVPSELTENMLDEADRAIALPEAYIRQIYSALINSAPVFSPSEPQTGERDREVERLTRERDEARAQTSKVAKLLSHEPPYQAGLDVRVQGLLDQLQDRERRLAEVQESSERNRDFAALAALEASEGCS